MSFDRLIVGTISKKDLKLALRIGEIIKTTKTTTKLIEIGKKHALKKYDQFTSFPNLNFPPQLRSPFKKNHSIFLPDLLKWHP